MKNPNTNPTFTEFEPNMNLIFKSTQNPNWTEPLLSENPKWTQTQNFGFFPISTWYDVNQTMLMLNTD